MRIIALFLSIVSILLAALAFYVISIAGPAADPEALQALALAGVGMMVSAIAFPFIGSIHNGRCNN